MFKLFFNLLSMLTQTGVFLIEFMIFSVALATFLAAIRAAYHLAQRPMSDLISECMAFPDPHTLTAIVKWAFRISCVLAPAICMKVIGSIIAKAIELFVKIMDNGFAAQENSD